MKTQFTPAPVLSLGTLAVMVVDCPALSVSDVAWSTTELKSEGTPEQLEQLLLCNISKIARQKKEGIPLFFTITTPHIL